MVLKNALAPVGAGAMRANNFLEIVPRQKAGPMAAITHRSDPQAVRGDGRKLAAER